MEEEEWKKCNESESGRRITRVKNRIG